MIVKRAMLPDVTPWRELEDLPQRFARAFGGPAWLDMMEKPTAFYPAVEIAESDTELKITIELAGMRKDDVSIEVEDGVLTIKGEKKEIKEDKQPQMHVWERRYGSFERAFTLPRGVDPNLVKADFHDGLLTIRVPNTAPIKGRKVEIGG
jgi:HSP20 family protein